MPKSRSQMKTEQSFNDAAIRIGRYAARAGRDAGVALRQIGEEIMTDVKASTVGHGVPVDTGALRASGVVTGPLGDAKVGFTVMLAFGGTAAGFNTDVGYALIQHEVLTFHHRVGEARYLVRGIERWKPGGSAAMRQWKQNAKQGVQVVAKGKK